MGGSHLIWNCLSKARACFSRIWHEIRSCEYGFYYGNFGGFTCTLNKWTPWNPLEFLSNSSICLFSSFRKSVSALEISFCIRFTSGWLAFITDKKETCIKWLELGSFGKKSLTKSLFNCRIFASSPKISASTPTGFEPIKINNPSNFKLVSSEIRSSFLAAILLLSNSSTNALAACANLSDPLASAINRSVGVSLVIHHPTEIPTGTDLVVGIISSQFHPACIKSPYFNCAENPAQSLHEPTIIRTFVPENCLSLDPGPATSIVLGTIFLSSANIFDLKIKVLDSRTRLFESVIAARSIAAPAICVVESSFAVNLRFSRPVISVTRIWPHVSSAKPITKINQPKWSNLCAHLGMCGSGSMVQMTESRFRLNQQSAQINASAPSITTPIMTSTNPTTESADQRLSDEASAGLIERSCRIQKIVGYGTLATLLLSVCIHAGAAAYRKIRK